MNNFISYNGNNIVLARNSRKNMTMEGRNLWYRFLRNHSERFYRQRCIGNYIADFYCCKMKLVIELDGSQHYEEQAERYDTVRTKYFAEQGISVLRFSNIDIKTHFAEVCQVIDTWIKEHKN